MYPERNAWYLEEIARLTDGRVPLFSSLYDVYAAVFVDADARQGESNALIAITDATPDEAIKALYQHVYAWSYQDDVLVQAS